MDPEKNNNLSPEEHTAEQEALAEAKEDDVRAKVIADLGLEDNDNNKSIIDKVVGREMEHRSTLSKAVKQKIDWRTKALGPDGKPKDPQKPDESKVDPTDPEAIRKAAAEATRAEFEQRDLDEMDYSDEVKEQIKRVAKYNNSSIRAAAKDPYIQSLIENETKQRKADEAAENGSGKTRSGVQIDTSKPLDPKDFDLSTEEGRAEWEEAKKARRNQGN